MKHLIMAIASLNAEIKKIDCQVQDDFYGMSDQEHRYACGRIAGLGKAVDILTEQLREAQPDVVRELTQIRAIINKM